MPPAIFPIAKFGVLLVNQFSRMFTMTRQFSRLPTSVVPSHYVIRLKPDLAQHTFQGEVTITAKVAEAVSEISCNAANLEIQKCTVSCGDGGSRVQDRASNDDSLKISQSRRRLK